MNKKTFLLVGIIVATLVLAGFFLIKTIADKKAMEPCRPPRTDCLVLNPKGTTYVPPQEENIATTTQSGKIDEHLFINNTLREVNFCGKTYQVRQVMIDGVDVVQRVAEIANEFNGGSEQDVLRAKSICGNVEFTLNHRTNADVKLLLNEIEILGPAIRNDISSTTVYILGIGSLTHISIDSTLQIEVSKAEEGGSIIIGKLK